MVFLVLASVLPLIPGAFLETNAAVIVVTPILCPAATRMGVDPAHFGIIAVVNLAVGMTTPPIGVNLFDACGLAKLKVEKIAAANWFFLPLASLIVPALLTFVPGITLLLPKLPQ